MQGRPDQLPARDDKCILNLPLHQLWGSQAKNFTATLSTNTRQEHVATFIFSLPPLHPTMQTTPIHKPAHYQAKTHYCFLVVPTCGASIFTA
jgi:hypothetical protein